MDHVLHRTAIVITMAAQLQPRVRPHVLAAVHHLRAFWKSLSQGLGPSAWRPMSFGYLHAHLPAVRTLVQIHIITFAILKLVLEWCSEGCQQDI